MRLLDFSRRICKTNALRRKHAEEEERKHSGGGPITVILSVNGRRQVIAESTVTAASTTSGSDVAEQHEEVWSFVCVSMSVPVSVCLACLCVCVKSVLLVSPPHPSHPLAVICRSSGGSGSGGERCARRLADGRRRHCRVSQRTRAHRLWCVLWGMREQRAEEWAACVPVSVCLSVCAHS